MPHRYATKQDVDNAIEELAQTTEKGFQHIRKEMATKEDVGRVEGKVDRLEQKVNRLEQKFDRLERGVKALLDSSKEQTQLLREIRKLPERVSRLERAVFR